ncbi:MAG TPA: glycosyl hydrolase family 65 protein [Blastocatellia bacterium]
MSVQIVHLGPEIPAAETKWSIRWSGFDPLRERDLESLMTIGNGYIGTCGSVEEVSSASRPLTLIAGVYDSLPEGDDIPQLAVAPDWLHFKVTIDGEPLSLESGEILEHDRDLDMKNGTLVRQWRHRDDRGRTTNYHSVRFASMADRHVMGMRVWIVPENYNGTITVESGIDGDVTNTNASGSGHVKYLEPVRSTAIPSGGVLLASRTRGHRKDVAPITVAMASRTQFANQSNSTDQANSPEHPEMCDPAQGSPRFRLVTNTDSLHATELIEWQAESGKCYVLDKLVTVWTSRDNKLREPSVGVSSTSVLPEGSRAQVKNDGHWSVPAAKSSSGLSEDQVIECVTENLRRATEFGLDRVLTESKSAWQRRWEDAEIEIDKSDAAERAIRFAMYHLIIAANPDDDHTSISARTLTGEVYNGHVFWDTEIFMLPFFIYTDPPSARSLLMYRYWTLDGARAKARSYGYKGAMYAWESADTGFETTPTEVRLPTGRVAKVLSGIEEHHISADIPYAVWQYWDVTGDDEFILDFGAEIICECARFWASRVTPGPDGKEHILKVIGPDEYHEDVNDDAFTNTMAAWTLQTACDIGRWMNANDRESMRRLESRIGLDQAELDRWAELAGRVYLGLDLNTGLIEQFAGFFKLKQLDLRAYEPRTAPLDMLLGHDAVQRAQVVKQADVLMLFQLLATRYADEVVRKNYEYYEPRTGHGSSLSPGTHALIAARLGLTTDALRYFKMAANIDLGNGMGNASGGVHGATCGSIWQALVFGFAGIESLETGLGINPNMPSEWGRVRIALVYRSRRLHIAIDPDPVRLTIQLSSPGEPLDIIVGSLRGTVRAGEPFAARLADDEWQADTIHPKDASCA